MEDKIESELKRLQEAGIIELVQFSKCAAPIVPVMKPDNTVRIYRDYKTTVNGVSTTEFYPLPKVENYLSSCQDNISQTWICHMPTISYELDDEAKDYVVINTHKGLFCYNR